MWTCGGFPEVSLLKRGRKIKWIYETQQLALLLHEIERKTDGQVLYAESPRYYTGALRYGLQFLLFFSRTNLSQNDRPLELG